MFATSKIFDSGLSLNENFLIAFHSHTFPIKKSPERLDCAISCICTSGSVKLEIDFIGYQIEKGAIVTVFPMQVVEQKTVSEDFSLMYIACSPELLQQVMFRFSPDFSLFLKENPVFKTSEKIYREDVAFWELIKEKYEDVGNVWRNEIITNLLRAYYLNVYNGIFHKLSDGLIKHTRRTEIMRMFINLMMQYYNQSREVSFYADKLNITPKYLSIVTQEERGKNAKRVIDDFMITEIKLQLTSTSKTALEISEALNFPDPAFFSKYFKRYTGLTPKQYRNKQCAGS